MGYPRIEKPHRFVCVCLFSPLEHASSMVKYLNLYSTPKPLAYSKKGVHQRIHHLVLV